MKAAKITREMENERTEISTNRASSHDSISKITREIKTGSLLLLVLTARVISDGIVLAEN